MEGWIKLHRKITETSFHNKPLVSWLFINLLILANHEPHKFIFNRKEIDISSGQLVTGRKELSKLTGISEQSIRSALVTLKSTSTITIKTTNKFSLISVCNWNKYQTIPASTSTSKLTNNQPTTNQQATTYKNDKNDKNDKTLIGIPIAGFASKKNGRVDFILKQFRSHMSRSPTESVARSRQVAQNFRRTVEASYHRTKGAFPSDSQFEGTVLALFRWFMDRDFSANTYKLQTVYQYVRTRLEEAESKEAYGEQSS